MQVFRITSAKVETVAMEKLLAWWHFVVKLKPSNLALFEQVCV